MRRRPGGKLPFSKICDTIADAPILAGYGVRVDDAGALEGQHPIRRWEYAMALHAIEGWKATLPVSTERDLVIADVGGAGSRFWRLLTPYTLIPIQLIDPALAETPIAGDACCFGGTVEEFVSHFGPDLGRYDVITCISVIEHVPQITPFVRALHTLLRPGGLLFLTTDYWDKEGTDVAHFHWMRERIYNEGSVRKLLQECRELGFSSMGTADWAYHGHQVYDYSVAALALRKKETVNGN